MKTPFRLAIVGCGDIARYIALFAKTIPNFRISTCCSANLPEAQSFARKYKIPEAEPDYESLLDHRRFDAIYLSVPHHLHLPMMQQAVARGIPVLCEKPIAATLEQAADMIHFVQQNKGKVGINYQYRYDRQCWQLKQELQHNRLGTISHIRINLPWHREADYFARSAWHKSLSTAGGGTLLTQGSHFLDVALWSMEAQPLKAMGLLGQRIFNQPGVEVEDLAMGILEFSNGILLNITSSMAVSPAQAASIEVYAEKGTLLYRSSFIPALIYRGIRRQPPYPNLPVAGVHALARSLQAFRLWVEEDLPYFTPIQSAYPVMAVVDAIYRSNSSGVCERIHNLEPGL